MTLDDIWHNPLMWTDCYNLSHNYLKINQDWEISHIYNRARPMILYGFNETVLKVLNQRIYEDQAIEADEYARKMGLNFPTDMWIKIANEFKGRIPLCVKSLPDGSWVPKGTPFAEIQNTEKGFGELVTWWEPMFLHASFASGCATRALKMSNYLKNLDLPNRFHSFGFRGHNSMENAYWASTAWNLYFSGTDDFHTKLHTPNAKISSIPATAHKVIQQFDDELMAYVHAIDQTKEKGGNIIALVIDTYNADRFIEQYSVKLAQYAQLRNIHIVFRPDSGNTLTQAMMLYQRMKHNKINNTNVIIGEGMTFDKVKEYDYRLSYDNIPLDYVSYGIGAGFYKDIDRDYLGWAMKTARSNGDDRMKFSNDSIKESIPGQVNLIKENNELIVEYTMNGLYQTIYDYNQRSTRPEFTAQSWDDIKEIANNQNINQYQIKLSPSVIQRKQEIRKKYGL